MDWTFRVGDLAIVASTLLGPILAVQAQSWVERRRAGDQRRVAIFRALMATRRSILSPVHVEALNVVPIEFYDRKKGFLEVVNAWKAYIDHLYTEIIDDRAWGEKRVDLLNAILERMSSALGYNFNSVEISRELYSPKGHAAIESDQDMIRRGLARIFRGETGFPMDVRSFPNDPALANQQAELQRQFLRWLSGDLEPKVATGAREGATNGSTGA